MLGLVAACTTTDRSLQWEVSVPNSMRDRVAYLETTIHEGDCAVAGRLRYRSDLPLGELAAPPPLLVPGLYAFSATAVDGACTPIGDDCETVTLPLEDGAIALSLETASLPPLCVASLCSEGRCTEGDAGTPDADAGDAALPCTFGDCTGDGCLVPSNVPPRPSRT